MDFHETIFFSIFIHENILIRIPPLSEGYFLLFILYEPTIYFFFLNEQHEYPVGTMNERMNKIWMNHCVSKLNIKSFIVVGTENWWRFVCIGGNQSLFIQQYLFNITKMMKNGQLVWCGDIAQSKWSEPIKMLKKNQSIYCWSIKSEKRRNKNCSINKGTELVTTNQFPFKYFQVKKQNMEKTYFAMKC